MQIISAGKLLAVFHLIAISHTDSDNQSNSKQHQNNEIKLTNPPLSVENNAGISIKTFTDSYIKDMNLSINTVNLNNLETHTDIL
ncbi:hypothetical protein [Bartonella refiksaydamii]|uniref:hypothetical protein n=1 Tax=Bartonella refiksaydamii TaxID=2654951 RepID=UPI0012EBD24A|nr:hypothetical protein [Bartonella refiksaydamii]